MPARRTVSMRQMELLVEFAESHRDIALGRFPGGPQAVQTTRKAWESVSLQLNSIADGTTKTPDQWRRYWIEFKAKTKGKAADSRRNASATGGGPNKLIPLNELEKRVLALIGPVAVEGLRGVAVPCEIPSVDESQAAADSGIVAPDPAYPSTSTTVTPSSAAYSIIVSEDIASESTMEVEWLDDQIQSPLGLEPESQTFTPPPSAVGMSSVSAGCETQPSDTEDIPTQNTSDERPVSSRENRQTRHSTPSASARSSRSQRHLARQERAPRWAYEIETRRIAAEERLAAAVGAGMQRLAAAVEASVQIMREIRDDVHSYVHR